MENLEEWFKNLSNTNKLIIVEGKKDKKVLQDLGCKEITTISNSLFLTLDKINSKEVIILTDLDKEGKKVYSIIKKTLQRKGIKIDNKFREFLFKNTEISHIEGLKKYF
ncbi:toprim domain-containing protein [Candidatus Woesearchaeota archaeon]|nr:toprim domain-containing protein [Candidatus Woesearchaeota archaeon]